MLAMNQEINREQTRTNEVLAICDYMNNL